jgi:hypothetical protein
MANVAPPSNKAAAKPICAALVMIFSEPSPDPAKEHPTGAGRSQTETLVATENVHAAAPAAFPANLIIVRRSDRGHRTRRRHSAGAYGLVRLVVYEGLLH